MQVASLHARCSWKRSGSSISTPTHISRLRAKVTKANAQELIHTIRGYGYVLRTASFGLALLYAALMAVSVLIIGVVVYWSIEASLEREMTARIDAEIELLKEELRSEGDTELIEEIQRRANILGLE